MNFMLTKPKTINQIKSQTLRSLKKNSKTSMKLKNSSKRKLPKEKVQESLALTVNSFQDFKKQFNQKMSLPKQ